MINGLKIEINSLPDVANKIKTLNGSLDTKLSDCKREMLNLELHWQSQGATAIRQSMNVMQTKFDEYKEIINEYCEFLVKTAGDYEITENVIKKNALSVYCAKISVYKKV
jgi:WXG100 family type VII secretion target